MSHMSNISKSSKLKDKIAVVIFLTPDQYEELKTTCEALGCSISEFFQKVHEVTSKWDLKFKELIVSELLKDLKEEFKR